MIDLYQGKPSGSGIIVPLKSEITFKKTGGIMVDELSLDKEYMDEIWARIDQLNVDEFSDVLGIQKTSQGFRFHFFNRPVLYDGRDFLDLSGHDLTPAIKTVLGQYMIQGPVQKKESSGKLVTFREFPGAGPLFSQFVANTGKTIEQAFSGRLNVLENKCSQLFGMPLNLSGCDLSVRFKALPKIPVIFQFNDSDDMFPAKAVFLFHDNAIQYLDLKSLGKIITFLTGLLIDSKNV
jgi:hypothetical protein